MLRPYETTIVVDAHLPGEQIDATIEKVIQFIGKHGGDVKFVDRWGKRRLAYEIARKQYGYYVYIRFEAEGSFIKVLERELKLDDAILRYLTVLVPKVVLDKEMEKEAKTPEKQPKEEHEGSTKTPKSESDEDGESGEGER